MEDVQARASLQIIQAGIDDKGWRMREEKNDSRKVEESVSKSMGFMISSETQGAHVRKLKALMH